MFQMEFHKQLSIVKEEDEPFGSSRMVVHGGDHRKSVFEQYRERVMTEGHVREVEPRGSDRFQRLASSNHAVQQLVLHPAALTRSLSAGGDDRSSSTDGPSARVDWKDVDLINFEAESPELPVQPQIDVDVDVIRELVKPFATSVNVIDGRLQRELHLMDNDVYNVRFSDPQAVVSKDVAVVEAVETSGNMGNMSNPANLRDSGASSSMRSSVSSGRSEEYQSASEDADAESSGGSWMKDEEKGSPATRAYNRAFNTIMRRKGKAAVHNSKHAKSMGKPLLAQFEEEKLQRLAMKEAKKEAKRVAEEAKRESEREQRELRELADPTPESVMVGFKELDMFTKASKGIHKLFHKHGGHLKEQQREPSGVADAREAKLVIPKMGVFEGWGAPSQVSLTVAQIRTAPRQTSKQKDLQFATVESNQRDVQPWTMEEYMAKNARLTEWNNRDNDEEFGGIENNNLLNNWFDDLSDDLDSDDD